jgi:protection-of-telomeres protein 1
MSTYSTETLVFPAAKIPDPSFTAAYTSGHRVIDHFRMPDTARNPSDTEQQYVIALRNWALEQLDFQSISVAPRTSLQSNSAASLNPAFSGPKLRPLKDIHDNGYYDLVGEVVRIWMSACYTTIYWTDYTSNKLVQSIVSGDEPTDVQRDGDPYGYTEGMSIKRKAWPGPTGKMCLQIFLWPPHSTWANNNITEKDLVFIKNVRIGTRTNMENLRADLNPDQRHPDQIDIRKLKISDPRCKELLERREQYWQQAESKPSEHLSKKEKKKRKRERERALKALKSAQQVNSLFPGDDENTNSELHQKKPSALKANPHGKCSSSTDRAHSTQTT